MIYNIWNDLIAIHRLLHALHWPGLCWESCACPFLLLTKTVPYSLQSGRQVLLWCIYICVWLGRWHVGVGTVRHWWCLSGLGGPLPRARMQPCRREDSGGRAEFIAGSAQTQTRGRPPHPEEAKQRQRLWDSEPTAAVHTDDEGYRNVFAHKDDATRWTES